MEKAELPELQRWGGSSQRGKNHGRGHSAGTGAMEGGAVLCQDPEERKSFCWTHLSKGMRGGETYPSLCLQPHLLISCWSVPPFGREVQKSPFQGLVPTMRGRAGEGVRGRDKASRQMPGRTAYLHFLCCFIQHSVLTTGKQSTLASDHAYKTRRPGRILNIKDKEKYSEHSGRKYRLLTKE